jgi:hypothetical protein
VKLWLCNRAFACFPPPRPAASTSTSSASARGLSHATMSAAMNALGDMSRNNDSMGTHPDLSLGSLASSGTPARPPRLPFSRKASAADAPASTGFRRAHSMLAQTAEDDDDGGGGGGGGVLNTPGDEKRRWDAGAAQEPTTPKPGMARSKSGRTSQGGPKVPTLRDQEKVQPPRIHARPGTD